MRGFRNWLGLFRSARTLALRWQATFHKPLGRRGEDLAARHLKQQGCIIVGRGVRSGRGELDIVAVQEQVIVFVEVKTRRSLAAGELLVEVIDEEKEKRITRAAYVYLKRNRLLDHPVRFDVITILWPEGGRPELHHYPHAFEAAGDDSEIY